MKKIYSLITIILVLGSLLARAQKPLTNSRTSSHYTYIYKCTNEEVLLNFKTGKKPVSENWFTNPIDSFKTDKNWNNTLPPGNYFLVWVSENKLNCRLVENHTAWPKILRNNVDTRFVMTDANGNQLNIPVTLNNQRVPFDKKTGTYHTAIKKKAVLRADYGGTSNYFEIKRNNSSNPSLFSKRWLRNRWYSIKRIFNGRDKSWGYRQRLRVIKNYTSFMAFNKPMYKPQDTVRFKAFILGKNGKPVSAKRLLVRIQEDESDEGKILGYVSSYRDGGFEQSFVLNDSLNLDLDTDYYISLEDPSSSKVSLEDYDGNMEDYEYLAIKREVFAAAKFSYEDYELKSTSFSMRTDKAEHSPGIPLSIYLKAVDENDLPVLDGRVTLTLLRNYTSRYKAPIVFVPDTLWTKKVQLETIGETKVIVPDSIFPKADFSYRISAAFLSSSNESRNASKTIDFSYNNYIIKHELVADSINVKSYFKGKLVASRAKVYGLSVDLDTISKTTLQLPGNFRANASFANYIIETDSLKHTIYLDRITTELNLSGYRTPDSLFVSVSNAHKIPFWYWITDGRRLYDAGNNTKPFYKIKLHNSGRIRFSVSYIWGGKTKYKHIDIDYADKILNIDVKQPLSVYPGQRINTEITITDANGNAIPDADVTAWSLTRKFSNYTIPFIPYLGKAPKIIKVKPYNILEEKPYTTTKELNWQKWRETFNLDAIEYYRFTHPTTIYKVEEVAPDNITQVAPFVVKDGEIQPVNILYIDGIPAYFDQAQQLSRYSFRVTPGRHNFKFRTSYESISVDTVFVKEGVKLIFSVNDTVGNKRIKIDKAPFVLDNIEADRVNKYLIKVVDNFGTKLTTIDQDNKVYLLNPKPQDYYSNQQILVGPLLPNAAFLNVQTQPWRSFMVEPNYSYLFEPGLIKQKSIPTGYPFSKFHLPSDYSKKFTDYALTSKEVDSIWHKYSDMLSHNSTGFINEPIDDDLRGDLTIVTNEKDNPDLFIKTIVVFRKNNPDYIRVYSGNTTNFGSLGAGDDYRLFFLLTKNAYYIAENIVVKPNGINYYDIKLSAHAADGVSREINYIITNPALGRNANSRATKDAEKLKQVFSEKYLDMGDFIDVMSGRVTDSKGETIIGATIMVSGMSKGPVTTNVNGEFTIAVPPNGTLSVRFIGFVEQKIKIVPGSKVNITLKEQSSYLQEVVVTGFGSSPSINVSNALQGRVAGLAFNPGASSNFVIRGNASLNDKPLIVVDGIIVESLDNLLPDNIAETTTLSGDAATGLYGMRAANGVIVITTKKKTTAVTAANKTDVENETGEASIEGSLRHNFSDYAYWQPKLKTNKQGKVSFTSTFPDDITNWRTFVAGISAKGLTGSAEAQIKSFKPISANLAVPQFAVSGDEIAALGKIFNYGTDSVKLNRTFKLNGQLIKQNDLDVSNSVIDTFKVAITGDDSVALEYAIKRESGYFDGEQRTIPVIKRGVTETNGFFDVLDKDTTVSMSFDPKMGPVTFRAESSVIPILAEETTRLREYIYQCNEQLASKLKGLLAEKRINEYLGKPFNWDRNIREVIKNLEDNKRGQGTWGWWKDSEEEIWISLHAIEALLEAKKSGYYVRTDFNKIGDYLIYQLNSYKSADKILCLQLLFNLNAKINYQEYINALEKDLSTQKKPSVYDTYRLMLVKQAAGLTINIDTLVSAGRRTMFGNLYWGESNTHFFDNSMQLTLLGYKILKAQGKHPELLSKIRGYFLEQYHEGEWRNTYETALILETILPDVLLPGQQSTPPVLALSGAKNTSITTFPYTDSFTAGALTIKKTGTMPVYVTGYQQFFNTTPPKVDKEFSVTTWFEKNGEKLNKLKGGEAVILKTQVDVKSDAEYIMINIPIPAGCSYDSKNQSWLNNEVHREHFKERVSIFCRRLKQGKYEFAISLMPRYSGIYNLNPAKAEMMYFPVFYGREALKQVSVNDH